MEIFMFPFIRPLPPQIFPKNRTLKYFVTIPTSHFPYATRNLCLFQFIEVTAP